MNSFEIFHLVTTRFADLRWSEFRDDLILKSMKALRKLRDGKDPSSVLEDQKVSGGIEDVIDDLAEFVRNSEKKEVNRVIDSLGMFLKAPAPCRTKIISLIEKMLGKVEAKG